MARKQMKKLTSTVRPVRGHAEYGRFLADLQVRIRAAQQRAALAVNRELIQLYWDIGRAVVDKQGAQGWGAGIIDRLSADIRKAFPGIEGFSATNISRMRTFYLAWTPFVGSPAMALPKLNGARRTGETTGGRAARSHRPISGGTGRRLRACRTTGPAGG